MVLAAESTTLYGTTFGHKIFYKKYQCLDHGFSFGLTITKKNNYEEFSTLIGRGGRGSHLLEGGIA